MLMYEIRKLRKYEIGGENFRIFVVFEVWYRRVEMPGFEPGSKRVISKVLMRVVLVMS